MKKPFLSQTISLLFVSVFAGTVLLLSHNASAQTPPWKGGAPVTHAGSVGGELLNLFYLGAAVEYDWAVARTWTIGGHLSIGSAFVGEYDDYKHHPKVYSRLHFRGRWHFDRGYRAKNGFTLRYNSGFFLEPAIGFTHVGSNHLVAYPLISVGYHYVTKSRLSMSAKVGGLVPFHGHHGLAPALELKLGYAF